MPGITGIIGRENLARHGELIQTMAARLVHAPDSAFDTYVNSELGISVGWTDQAGTISPGTPVWNESQDVGLILSGETFGDIGRTSNAAHPGAQHVIERYERDPENFAGGLNGVFCAVIVDLRRRQIRLFNDRYGLGRLYYRETREGFYFSSEAKSLLAAHPDSRSVDARALGELLSCGCVLGDRTLFPGIAILPGASCWTFGDNDRRVKRRYFDAREWEEQSPLSPEEYEEQLGATFARLLPPYLAGTGPIGLSMTGGIDSRLILAAAAFRPPGMRSYTFGGTFRESMDVKLARQLSRSCNLSHDVITVGEEFIRQFPTTAPRAVYLSDGTMDVSGAVELYANERARAIAPVRLTGNYGSEILRANIAFRPKRSDEGAWDAGLLPQLRQAESTYAQQRQCKDLSFIAFKQVPWFHYARFSVEKSQLTVRSPYLDHDLVKLAFRQPASLAGDSSHLLRVISKLNPNLTRVATDRNHTSERHALMPRIRRYTQEFTAKTEYAYDYGMPQWLARIDRVLSPLHMERVFLGRHKFYHFRYWYRHALAGFVREVLLDSQALSRPHVDRRNVDRMVASHLSGRGNHTVEIHKLLTCEFIYRSLIARN